MPPSPEHGNTSARIAELETRVGELLRRLSRIEQDPPQSYSPAQRLYRVRFDADPASGEAEGTIVDRADNDLQTGVTVQTGLAAALRDEETAWCMRMDDSGKLEAIAPALGPLRLVQTDAQVNAASNATTPGSAAATVYEWDGSSQITSNGGSITVYNFSTEYDVAANAICAVGSIAGIWVIVSVFDCAELS